MSDLIDYLKWRGDLSFERDGFNEVDNLIFSGLSYIDFVGIVPGTCGSSVTLASATAQLKAAHRLELKGLFLSQYPDLLQMAARSVRFRDVALTCYVSEMDDKKPNQFSAIVFSIGKREHYIAFRGTDDNLAGWKEDFLMSFKEVILAQKQAAQYLNTVIPQLPGRFYVGGHSKGGNLAVFSSAHTPEKNRRRISAVYNNDGPGFQSSIIGSEGYKKIENRICTFIPKSSVVGMLLEHDDNYRIIASTERGLLSHNPMTWSVSGTAFVREKELSKSSRQISQALRTWLGGLTLEQREQFVEALFDLISASGAQTLSDFSKERLSVMDAMIRKLKSMDKQTRKVLKDTVLNFFSIRQRMLIESLSQSVETLLVKKT